MKRGRRTAGSAFSQAARKSPPKPVKRAPRESFGELLRRVQAKTVRLHPPVVHTSTERENGGLGIGDLLILAVSDSTSRMCLHAEQWLNRVAVEHLRCGGAVYSVAGPAARGLSAAGILGAAEAKDKELDVSNLHIVRIENWTEVADESFVSTHLTSGDRPNSPCVPLLVVDIHTEYLQHFERFTGQSNPIIPYLLHWQRQLGGALIIVEQLLPPPAPVLGCIPLPPEGSLDNSVKILDSIPLTDALERCLKFAEVHERGQHRYARKKPVTRIDTQQQMNRNRSAADSLVLPLGVEVYAGWKVGVLVMNTILSPLASNFGSVVVCARPHTTGTYCQLVVADKLRGSRDWNGGLPPCETEGERSHPWDRFGSAKREFFFRCINRVTCKIDPPNESTKIDGVSETNAALSNYPEANNVDFSHSK